MQFARIKNSAVQRSTHFARSEYVKHLVDTSVDNLNVGDLVKPIGKTPEQSQRVISIAGEILIPNL
jgi:hypothetical protein